MLCLYSTREYNHFKKLKCPFALRLVILLNTDTFNGTPDNLRIHEFNTRRRCPGIVLDESSRSGSTVGLPAWYFVIIAPYFNKLPYPSERCSRLLEDKRRWCTMLSVSDSQGETRVLAVVIKVVSSMWLGSRASLSRTLKDCAQRQRANNRGVLGQSVVTALIGLLHFDPVAAGLFRKANGAAGFWLVGFPTSAWHVF